MMRYALVIAAIILAACTFPPQQQNTQVSPAVEITAPREEPDPPKVKEPKQKIAPAPSAPPPQPVHPCAGIETGDAKSDVKAKLECLEEHG